MSQRSSSLLIKVLLIDAGVSGATGIGMFTAAGPLAELLGLPAGLLRWAGLALVPFAAFLLWLARRSPVPRGATLAVVAANLLWTLASVGLLLSGRVAPTLLGTVFTLGQALAVAVFAEFQYVGLQRARATI